MYAAIQALDPRLAVCHLSGSLERECLEHLRAVMEACAAFPDVQFDLSGVVFVDSAALGVLVGGIRRIRDRDGTVVASGVKQNIRRLLYAMGFDRVATIRDGSVVPLAPAATIAS